MHGKTAERRLAAILIADLVGYSRLIGVDEAGTIRRLRAVRRELIDPAIVSAHGRVVKSTGDGIIAEFPSTVRAVSCAVAIQKAMTARYAREAADRGFALRIGINVGDVIAEPDGDLYGDGVNVAARIEPLSQPGGLCVSRAVYDQVRNTLHYPFEDCGEQALKNIARPIGIYALGPTAIAGIEEEAGLDPASEPALLRGRGVAAAAAGALLALLAAAGLGWWAYRPVIPAPRMPVPQTVGDTQPAPRLSIVVLPFANLSNDPEQDIFADGLTEDLTTDLSHLDGSFVIARNTAFTYKGKAVDVKQIGRDLGVRYALEGSVRRTSDKVVLNAQLISTETGAHLWAERFEGDRTRLGELQVEFVVRLARSLDIQLIQAESLRSLRERPRDPTATDLAMLGRNALNKPRTSKILEEAITYFEKALSLDPNSMEAKVGLARTITAKIGFRWSTNFQLDIDRASNLIDEILQENPNSAQDHVFRGEIYKAKKQFDKAASEYEIAIKLDPNYIYSYHNMSIIKIFMGKAAEAFQFSEKAMRLSPRDPIFFVFEHQVCHAYMHVKEWAKAIEWCDKSASRSPYWLAYIDLAAAHALLGNMSQARAAVTDLLKVRPGYTVQKWINEGWSDNPIFLAEFQYIVDGLRKAGLPEQ